MTPEQFKKLPKYAREEIGRLGKELDSALRDLEIQTGQTDLVDTDTRIRNYTKADVLLEPGTTIAFGPFRNGFQVRWEENHLRVMGDQSRLVVEPRTANVVHISIHPEYLE